MSSQHHDNPQEVRPSTYLITFVCYGSWLPGQPGAVPRGQNVFGTRLPEANANRERLARNRMRQQPYLLDAIRRKIVLRSLQEVCFYRHWSLMAAHVRTNHVHVVVTANQSAERVMNTFKAYASRGLNRMALDSVDCRRWARHGSTRHLWTREAVTAAVHYVVWEQGEAMAVFETSSAR
jgi:REP element-mobilizing transposase RayT